MHERECVCDILCKLHIPISYFWSFCAAVYIFRLFLDIFLFCCRSCSLPILLICLFSWNILFPFCMHLIWNIFFAFVCVYLFTETSHIHFIRFVDFVHFTVKYFSFDNSSSEMNAKINIFQENLLFSLWVTYVC